MTSAPVYPELAAVVGSRTPDLRGLFLRGVGGNSAGLGVAQGDAIRNITGRTSNFKDAHGAAGSSEGALRSEWFMSGGGSAGNEPSGNFTTYFDASHVVPTAEENRPVNKAVRYLIRAKS